MNLFPKNNLASPTARAEMTSPVPTLKVDDVENEDLNVLEIVVSHRVDEHIEDDTLWRTDVDPTIVERPIVRHVTDDFIDDVDEHLSHASGTSTMSFPRTNFLETDAMSLEFADDLDNLAGGSSSVGDNSGFSSQPSATSTPRRRAQSRLLELGTTQAMDVCVRKTFPVRCLKWADVGREYIEVIKSDLQGDCHRHVKKYSDPKEARANPPHLLMGRDED
ncbi:CACTA en-spm transposon protein [Cucumis melo var. makuwa]|uniref:CACTA en-spm transposon protein n=1 Tax=Cucumis melo var. makuwa TaxID=1194695 RepID=A0A5A7V479_CUCMM|nr:CACTA en-spm transposon protein [Cucumis melo var. makuwa]